MDSKFECLILYRKSHVEVIDNNNGEYFVNWVPVIRGIHQIEIGVQTNKAESCRPILGSPFEVNVVEKQDGMQENLKLKNDIFDLNKAYQELKSQVNFDILSNLV
jgi:hypothetical protein